MLRKYTVIAAAVLLAYGGAAYADAETAADNDSVGTAQPLVIPSSGSVTVTGAIGAVMFGETAVPDVDFYSFHGTAGDDVTIDIDYGIKARPTDPTMPLSLDSVVVIYNPDLTILHQVDDLTLSAVIDPESLNRFDPFIQIKLLQTGTHYIGVTGAQRDFEQNGAVTPPPVTLNSMANGSYELVLSGVTPTVTKQTIAIDIKPDTKRIAKIDPRSKRSIAVALLGDKTFDPRKVDVGSVTFGPSGTEARGRCGKELERYRRDDDDDEDGSRRHPRLRDINRDGFVDVICRFEIRAAGFDESDSEGVVKGTVEGKAFEGRGWLKVKTRKRHHHHHD